jgi:molecular chaperone HscB
MDILRKNYFDLFGLRIDTKIDLDRLEKNYKLLQKQFHPDKYASATNHEKKIALQVSSFINDAYRTLSDLPERISYILKINNFEKDESVTLKDENFLHEQIEYSEFLIDIENKTSKEISEKHIKNLDKTTNILMVLDKAFVENNFEEMWECLSKLRFYLKHGKEFSKAMGDM